MLYGTSNALQLPFKGLKEFVVLWMREAMTYMYSKDLKVAAAGIKVCTGKKWSAKKDRGKAEE